MKNKFDLRKIFTLVSTLSVLTLAGTFITHKKFTINNQPPYQTPSITLPDSSNNSGLTNNGSGPANNPANSTSSNQTPATYVSSANIKQPKSINRQPLESVSPTLAQNPNALKIPYFLLGTTNDPWLGNSWAMTKIQANRAWDLSTGSSSVAVAVIDTGFELNHQELANRWFTNSGEIGQTAPGDYCWDGAQKDKSTNNCDDDQNGYIDDFKGYDFANLDNSPQAGETNANGEATHHGSMVAGVVGAAANNNVGSAGIDQSAKILPLQVFTDDGQADTNTVTAAVDYATDMGVKVINLSLGSDTADPTLLSAINRARTNGVLVIAASGNCALNDDPICNNLPTPGRMTYPALHPQVLAVGSTDTNDNRSNFSSYGPQLDISAPGDAVGPLPVFYNNATNYYSNGSGTSYAAPLVAGLASILIAQNPGATLTELENTLKQSADTTPEMNSNTFSNFYGFGRINAHKATLLNLAKTQTNLLGNELTKVSLPPAGALWRASTGSVAIDEWLLFGCRTFQTDICTVTLTKGASKYQADSLERGDQIRYLFVKGSTLNSNGTWSATAHNSHFASSITTITK